MILFGLLSICLADMVDYGGENRYYGEAIREALFKRPYNDNRFRMLYDPNVIPIGSMNFQAISMDEFGSLTDFVNIKCDKYIAVSEAQYGNFDIDGRQGRKGGKNKDKKGSSSVSNSSFNSNNNVEVTEPPPIVINYNIDWTSLDNLHQNGTNGESKLFFFF